jgi:hypothetical protein
MEKVTLKQLTLMRADWGNNIGRFTGSARFDSPLGEVCINLDADTSDQLLYILSQHLIKSAGTVANAMQQSIKDHTENTALIAFDGDKHV